jgi:hypothetical protein
VDADVRAHGSLEFFEAFEHFNNSRSEVDFESAGQCKLSECLSIGVCGKGVKQELKWGRDNAGRKLNHARAG